MQITYVSATARPSISQTDITFSTTKTGNVHITC